MRPTDDQKLHELVHRLRAALDPCEIYLFGSRAKGAAGSQSDYDLMVIIPDTTESLLERYRRVLPALRGFGAPVDVLIYTRSEWVEWSQKRHSIARAVRDSGILLHAA